MRITLLIPLKLLGFYQTKDGFKLDFVEIKCDCTFTSFTRHQLVSFVKPELHYVIWCGVMSCHILCYNFVLCCIKLNVFSIPSGALLEPFCCSC